MMDTTPFIPYMLPLAQAQSGGTREMIDGLARTPLSHVVWFVLAISLLRLAVYPYLKNTKVHMRHGIYPVVRYINEMLDAFVYAGVFVFMVIRPFILQAFLVPSGSMWPTLEVNDFIIANKAIYRFSEPKSGDIIVFHPPALAAISQSDLDKDGEMKTDYVKRCIGVPGDLIELKKGVLYRNGQKVDEEYRTYSECSDPVQTEEPCQTFRVLSDDVKKQLTMASFKLVKRDGEIIPLNYTDMDANAPMPQTGSAIEDKTPYHVARPFQAISTSDQLKVRDLPAEKVPAGYYLMMGDNRNNSHDGRVWGLVPRDRLIGKAVMTWWPFTHIHLLK